MKRNIWTVIQSTTYYVEEVEAVVVAMTDLEVVDRVFVVVADNVNVDCNYCSYDDDSDNGMLKDVVDKRKVDETRTNYAKALVDDWRRRRKMMEQL